MKLLTSIILVLIVFSAYVKSETAYFQMTDYSNGNFVFKLTNDDKINTARKILNGTETETTHVMGRIKKSKQSYNSNFDYHYDPDTISFFQLAIEVCDATMFYVEKHLDEACGAFLPGCYWCPWSSRLTKEVNP